MSAERPTGLRRIVVKVGTSTLTAKSGEPDAGRIDSLCDQVASIAEAGTKAVVVSSGAIASGMGPLGLSHRPSDMPTLQAAAAVGQPRLMDLYAESLEERGIPVAQVLLTHFDMVHRRQYVNARNTLERLLELGAVPIVNENDTVAVEEIRYGDNDRLAALVANIIGADLLVMLSDVEGLFTSDPRKGGADLLATVEEVTPALLGASRGRSQLGSGGMTSKLEAARVATLSGVGVVIASGERPDVLLEICEGKQIGTYLPARRSRLAARKLWIAWAPAARGRLVIDDGAVEAIVNRNKSLLAAGVRGVEGKFGAGDAVEVVAADGEAVAKGLVGFDSEVLSAIAGSQGGREVIHRDQLVLWKTAPRD